MRITTAMALLGLSSLLLTASQAVGRGTPEEGRIVFEQHCATCHGLRGRGDGPLAPFLSPHPASLVSAGTSVKTDTELFQVITEGKPRTAMLAWKDKLTEEQRWDLVAYIRTLVSFHEKPKTPGPPDTLSTN